MILTKQSVTIFKQLAGSKCNCILPKALKATTVQHDPRYEGQDSEKKRLRSGFSCLSSISMNQKEVSISSLFLHSHYKGCLPPWELKDRRVGHSSKEKTTYLPGFEIANKFPSSSWDNIHGSWLVWGLITEALISLLFLFSLVFFSLWEALFWSLTWGIIHSWCGVISFGRA